MRRMSRKERERRRRIAIMVSVTIVILIVTALVFLVKSCADKKKVSINQGDINNNSTEISSSDNNSTERSTTDNATTAQLEDKTQQSTNSNSGDAVKQKTSKGYTIETINGVTYIDGYLIANKTYSLPSDFIPQNPEVPVTEARSNKSLDKDLMEAFRKMQAAASAKGLNIYIASGYRSYDYQVSLYNRYVANDGKAAADTYSSRPGNSEHQTGLCFDLNSIEDSFQYTNEGKWVNDNCYKYGFCIRFPKGKEAYTGYQYESWHLRYVGEELAEKLYNNGDWISLEEYFGITSEYTD